MLQSIEDVYFEEDDQSNSRLHEQRTYEARVFFDQILEELGLLHSPSKGSPGSSPLIQILGLGKGCRLIGTLIQVFDAHASPELLQAFKGELLDTLLGDLEYIVVRISEAQDAKLEEAFIHHVLSPLVSYVATASWDRLTRWLDLLLSKSYFAELALKKVRPSVPFPSDSSLAHASIH